MRYKLFASALSAVVGAASAVSADPIQWEAANGGNGHWYEFITSDFGFVGDLEVLAESLTFMGMGGYLATITSQAEQDFLNSIWPGALTGGEGSRYEFGNNFAIGISDRDEEGVFRYMGGPEGGQIISYSNWNPFEPNDAGGGEDYALGWWQNNATGRWNDANFAAGGYVVEFGSDPSVIPIPGALPLLISGIGEETVATLEVRVAELSAALEQAQVGLRSNDAANATIADLREELEALRPLTAQLDTLTEQSNSLQRQISAANETVADLRDGIASDERVGELQRQLDAANATVANLRDDIIGSYVPVADYVNLQRQVSALTATNAEMRERVQADFVPRAEYGALEVSSRDAQDALRSQLAAANQTVAELRERMNSAYVPVADHVELQRQLAAASATNTELRETMRSDYVSRADFLVAQRILAATNESMVDLRRSIETQFMPLDDYQRLERQLSALNSTILELQDRNEIQRNRMVESEALFRNFREDCAAVPECARAMRLEGLSP